MTSRNDPSSGWIGLIALTALIAVFACSPEARAADCLDSADTQTAITQCARDKMDAALAVMKRIYERCRDEKKGEEQQRFVEVQKAWEQYSKLSCQQELDNFFGGSGGPAAFALCMEDQAKQRTETLRHSGTCVE